MWRIVLPSPSLHLQDEAPEIITGLLGTNKGIISEYLDNNNPLDKSYELVKIEKTRKTVKVKS